ncbi:MAG: CaiB/BaiF CoA-transferase family protein [Leptospiraceae bacterium]|nr:CaiB/BaiF CoA-transferase family protein [Leptospiraceae bacterium]
MSSDLPLKGVKVLDLSLLLPGPLCSMYLGDMGAEVIKVENPRVGDGTRYMFRSSEGVPGLYLMLNRNKKAITLNLKRKESHEILYKLLENTDILLEGFRPDAMEEMGIGYDVLHKKFPRLIYCGIYGYGATGNRKDFAGHDGNYLALSGMLEQMGTIESPALAGFQLADIGGGSLTALAAILAALYAREKNGLGRKIDISMMESSLQFLNLYIGIYLSTGESPKRGDELLSGRLPNYNLYRVKNDRFVFLGTLEERFFRSFLRAIGQESTLSEISLEEKNFHKWKRILEEFFAEESFESLSPIFENKEACLTPVKTVSEVFDDLDLKERKLFFEMEHPKFGKIKQIGSPISFLRGNESRIIPPDHGEHTAEILQSIGIDSNKIQELRKGKII